MQQEDPAFFTGKPYLASTDTYAFKFRSYDPNVARWTSEDPSGFPDGANASFYAPTPNSELDYLGLWKIKVVTQLTNGGLVWSDHTGLGGVGAVAGVVPSIGNGTTASSINLASQASAVSVSDTTTISQSYVVNVSSTGALSISGTGSTQKSSGGLAIASAGSQITNGNTLTFTYEILGAKGGAGLTAVGATILGVGGNLGWTNSTDEIGGSVSITFEAVE